jgi:hypothetical protein
MSRGARSKQKTRSRPLRRLAHATETIAAVLASADARQAHVELAVFPLMQIGLLKRAKLVNARARQQGNRNVGAYFPSPHTPHTVYDPMAKI